MVNFTAVTTELRAYDDPNAKEHKSVFYFLNNAICNQIATNDNFLLKAGISLVSIFFPAVFSFYFFIAEASWVVLHIVYANCVSCGTFSLNS